MRLALLAACGAVVVVPLVYAPGLDAPYLAPKFSALELCAALGFLAAALRGPRLAPPLVWAAAALLATTALAWAAAPAAPYAVDATARWLACFGVAAAAATLAGDGEARQTLLESAAAAAAVVSALGLWQHLQLTPLPMPVFSAPGATFGNRNLAAEAVAVALPLTLGALLGARGRAARLALMAGLALELIYLAATRTRGAWIGGAAGLVAAVALARPRWPRAAWITAAAALLLAAAAAVIPGPSNPRDVGDRKHFASAAEVARATFDPRSVALRTRLGLWRRTLRMIGDHPLLGVGPGNWPVAFPRYAEPGAAADGVLSRAVAPRQAHDDLLERAAETGVPGLLALLVFTAAALWRVRPENAAPAGALAALLGCGLTGFPLEMPATLALGGVALGLLAGEAPAAAWRGPRRAIAVAAAAGLLLAAAVRAERRLATSVWLAHGERALASGDPARARAALLRAGPGDLGVELLTAVAEQRLGRPAEAVAAARRALALEPDCPNAWEALASGLLAAGDRDAARAAAARTLMLLHDYPLAPQLRDIMGN